MSVADQIVPLMKARNETHAQVAAAIGLEPDKFSKSINGTRRFTSLECALLAEHFGVSVFFLLELPELRQSHVE